MGDTSNLDAPRAQEILPPPQQVADGAQTCVQYVEKNLGVALDFSVETLPVLDHYLRLARTADSERPETGALVATVAGCYVGEVLRLRHDLRWDLSADDPLRWKLASPERSLVVFPVALARVAIEGPAAEPNFEVFALETKLRNALARRLDELPAVPEEEYVAPSTRVEVVDIAIDLLTGWYQQVEPSHSCDCGDDCSCKHEHN
jgi:hypothetical protein